jgi:hypothetical protein
LEWKEEGEFKLSHVVGKKLGEELISGLNRGGRGASNTIVRGERVWHMGLEGRGLCTIGEAGGSQRRCRSHGVVTQQSCGMSRGKAGANQWAGPSAQCELWIVFYFSNWLKLAMVQIVSYWAQKNWKRIVCVGNGTRNKEQFYSLEFFKIQNGIWIKKIREPTWSKFYWIWIPWAWEHQDFMEFGTWDSNYT